MPTQKLYKMRLFIYSPSDYNESRENPKVELTIQEFVIYKLLLTRSIWASEHLDREIIEAPRVRSWISPYRDGIGLSIFIDHRSW